MQTFTPIQYLMLDIASNFGLDKETWDDRLAWFATVQDDILSNNIADLTKQAEEPALFFAGCKAFCQAKKGKSITYPISLDATASGAQILSALIGCEKSARMCNVLDTGRREDLYTNVNTCMNTRLGTDNMVPRADSKQATMTALYGSKKEPKRVFGEDDQLDAFYAVMEEEVPGIWELNEALLTLTNPEATEYSWVLPDNFHVKTKVMTTVDQKVLFLGDVYIVPKKVQGPVELDLSLGANTVHSIDGMIVREIMRRCSFDQAIIEDIRITLESGLHDYKSAMDREQDQLLMTLWEHYLVSGFLSARILELMDDQNMWWVDHTVILKLIYSMPKKPFQVLSVHDCFRVHPNYGNDLRRQYNQLLSEIAQSDMLQFLVDQIRPNEITVTKKGDLSLKVLESNYALS